MTDISLQKINGTPNENCLFPLLKALNWQGADRSLKEAMPHFSKIKSITDFCNVLKAMHFDPSQVKVKLNDLDERLLPALLVTDAGHVFVLLQKNWDEIKIFDGNVNREDTLDLEKASLLFHEALLYIFKKTSFDHKVKSSRGWFWVTIAENKGLFYSAIFLSFFLNILMLATPLFVMFVYDS